MANKIYESVAVQIDKVLDDYEDEKLLNDLGDIALYVCQKYQPILQADAKAKIKHPSKSRPFVNYFKAAPLKDDLDTPNNCHGAVLYNKKYTLSHLVEDPHYVGGGGHTHNNYEIFKGHEDEMVKEFEDLVDKYLDKLGG